jgi:Spy/CpxP family protein refolding chaperone
VTRRPALIVALLVALLAGLAAAQPALAQTDSPAIPRPDHRPALEQKLRTRWLGVVRERLQLTDAQMARLEETNRHFSAQRTALNQAERGIRREMRGQLSGTATADDKRLAVLIDSLLDIQRQRLEIVRGEQRELAMFMTPLQRVRYLALQEQLRQRIEALRQRRRAGAPDF